MTIAFFVLKCLDVPFLRLRGRGAKIAFLLVCAFAHRGAVLESVAEKMIDHSPLIVVAGAITIKSSRRVRQLVRGGMIGAIRALQRSLARVDAFVHLVLGFAWHTPVRHRVPIFRIGEPARGPPELAF